MGCGLESEWKIFLLCDQFLQALRIKADHHFFAHDYRRRRAAFISAYHLADSSHVAAHIAQLERYASLREVGFRPIARRSTRLTEQQDAFRAHITSLPDAFISGCPSSARDG
jgi:hypothetical protein